MPGRNAREAVEAFLEPLRTALNVLDGYSQIIVSQRGGYRIGGEYTWVLCGLDGMTLAGLGNFHAEMRFKVIEADPAKHEGPVRVTTTGYRYRLVANDEKRSELFLIHWHPTGNSPYKDPHIHMPPDTSRHLATGRITLEKAITWCIEHGAATSCGRDEALNRLALSEAPHVLFRSWSDNPSETQRGTVSDR